ncbi:phosphoribosylformylglycinamidine synthase subunit PurQ, partial [Flagellimonas flava]|uniref:phosphoribosylformylglycinamidine synthase subunit PurQ n=1 Tax=Flagellimonas flava TaxID=570519 RepID=UPI003D658DB0
SYLLDDKQTANDLAKARYENFKNQPLVYELPEGDASSDPMKSGSIEKPKAAILREKGSNCEREMANALFLAGFDVK